MLHGWILWDISTAAALAVALASCSTSPPDTGPLEADNHKPGALPTLVRSQAHPAYYTHQAPAKR